MSDVESMSISYDDMVSDLDIDRDIANSNRRSPLSPMQEGEDDDDDEEMDDSESELPQIALPPSPPPQLQYHVMQDDDDNDDDDIDGERYRMHRPVQDEEPEMIEVSDSPDSHRRRRAREQDEYYQDEYGDGDVDVIRLRDTVLGPDPFGENDRLIDEDDEEEEYVAGMILPKVVLDDEDIYMRELCRVLCAMGNETTRLLNKILVDKGSITVEEERNCRAWIKYWTIYYVENYYTILGKIIPLPTGRNGEKESFSGGMCVRAEIWRLKLIVNFNMLPNMRTWKISDSEFLVKWLIDTPGVRLDCPPKEPKMKDVKGGIPTDEDRREYEQELAKYKEKLDKFNKTRKIADTPILMLRQAQVMHLAQFITGRIKIIPYTTEIRKLLEYLELKCAMFFCQTMPSSQMNHEKFRVSIQSEIDAIRKRAEEEQQKQREQQEQHRNNGGEWRREFDEAMEYARERQQQQQQQQQKEDVGKWEVDRFTGNRDFWIYCTCYFYPLTRYLYYVDLLPRLNLHRAGDVESYLPEGAIQRLEAWMRQAAKRQGDKYFDRLEEAAEEGLLHDGDMQWHLYRYPEESTNIAVVVRKTRGENAYEDYHEQTGLSHTVIMDQVNRNWLSNTYVVNLFDRYLNTYKQTEWAAGYLVPNPFIDEPETMDKWQTTKEPLLVNIFNSYWLMMEGKVLPIDNIYTAICMWMVAIRKTRQKASRPKDCLADNTFIGDIIDSIVFGKENQIPITDENEQRNYEDKLRRGVPVTSTRIHI